jgi:cellobiose transport system substrate-binding protein
MVTNSRNRLRAGLVAVGLVASIALAACSSSDGAASSDDASAKQTITIGLFGTFGYKEAGLYEQYMKLHPNITIKENNVATAADYWTRLKTRLASGTGLDDVQAIEIGFVADVVQNHADEFVNFAAQPNATALKSSYFPWKWQLATTLDSKTTVALGVDAAPEAMCYRPEMLKQAGLPTDPAVLASQWANWDDYVAFGKKYMASSTKPAGSAFVDSAASLFNPAVFQGDTAFVDETGKTDVAGSPGVQAAWKYASDAATAKITAGLAQFSPQWNKGFSGAKFATLSCPTWMMGYIQSQMGPTGSGKWAVAPVLPGGGANWGGSFLGVPKASKHQKAALAFAEWLTAKDQQITMWTKGVFPANRAAAASPEVVDSAPAYFSKSPIGKIYNTVADSMKIPPIGVYDSQIQAAFTTQLTNVEKGTSPSKAWNDALSATKQITG